MEELADLVKIHLIKYIGLLKVYSKKLSNSINKETMYDVKISKSDKGHIQLNHSSGLYELIPDEIGMTIVKISEDGSIDRTIATADVEIRSDLTKITSFTDFNLRLSKIPRLPFSDIDRLFYSFRRALTKKIHSDISRAKIQVSYQQISPYKLELDNQIEGTDRITGYIGSVSVNLINNKGRNWKLDKIYTIPKSGILTYVDPTNNYEYNIFKYKKFRQALNDPQLPSSPMGRIRSLLIKYNRDLNYNKEIKFISDHEMTKYQEEILNRLISDPLVIVDSVAGTGKTTTVANAILELIQRDKRILVVAHSHRVLEAIIEMLTMIDKSVDENLLRIATKKTRKKVIHKKFLLENVITLEKQIMIGNLNKALESETNKDIREIQKKLIKIIESDNSFSSLISLSKKIVIATADSLLSQSFQFYKNLSEIQTLHPTTAEFDLVIIEDSSDINFPTLIHSCQFSYRWAFIGDMFQSAPVVPKSHNIPKYQDRKLPKLGENITQVTDLFNEKKRSLNFKQNLDRIDNLLRTQALSMLSDQKYFDMEDHFLNLKKWHRSTPELGKFIVNCFNILKDHVDFSSTHKKNIPINLIEVIDSHSPKIAEEVYEGDMGGFTNTHEINLLINWLTNFLNKISDSSVQKLDITIGIYAPFNIQIDLIIQSIVEEFPNFYENDRFIQNSLQNIKIHVNSLHNHKNREYDIMILSCTRSQIRGELKDEKDMFTIISRAKQSLVFCFDIPRYKGSWNSIKKQFIQKHKRETGPWSYILQYIEDNEEIVI